MRQVLAPYKNQAILTGKLKAILFIIVSAKIPNISKSNIPVYIIYHKTMMKWKSTVVNNAFIKKENKLVFHRLKHAASSQFFPM